MEWVVAFAWNQWKASSGIRSQVHRDIQAALKEFQGLHGQCTELMVELELARLDHLHRAVWPLAIGADPNDLLAAPTNPPDLRAMDRCIRIMERRAKLLGLDAPAKVAPTDPTGSKPYTGGGLAALLAISEGGV